MEIINVKGNICLEQWFPNYGLRRQVSISQLMRPSEMRPPPAAGRQIVYPCWFIPLWSHSRSCLTKYSLSVPWIVISVLVSFGVKRKVPSRSGVELYLITAALGATLQNLIVQIYNTLSFPSMGSWLSMSGHLLKYILCHLQPRNGFSTSCGQMGGAKAAAFQHRMCREWPALATERKNKSLQR